MTNLSFFGWTAPLSLTNSHVCCVYHSLNIKLPLWALKTLLWFPLQKSFYMSRLEALFISFSESTVQCHPWGSTPQNRQRILGQEGSTVIHLAASRPAWTQRGERHEKQDESADHMTKNTKGTMLASLNQISVVRNRQDRFCFMDSQCHWIYWKYMTIINIDIQL